MEVGSLRHPGATTIGSQLLDEATPMAGKSWQWAPTQKVRQAPVTLVKQWKEREGREGGNILEDVLPRKTLTINTIPVMAANTSQSGILTHAQYQTPLTTKGMQALFVVNSVN